jgi:putative oxidoreductase
LYRLFLSFTSGWPGAGLLLMRLVAGIALIDRGIIGLLAGPHLEQAVVDVLATGAGILLLAGFWTPIAGGLAAAVEVWRAIAHQGDPWMHILLAALGAGLALVGPGKWSVDARLFGWKRLDIPKRGNSLHSF